MYFKLRRFVILICIFVVAAIAGKSSLSAVLFASSGLLVGYLSGFADKRFIIENQGRE